MGEASEGELRCPIHPQRPAVAACAVCERLTCAACRVVGADGLSRCTDCVMEAEAGPDEDPAEAGAEAGGPEPEGGPPPRPARPWSEPPLPGWAVQAEVRAATARGEVEAAVAEGPSPTPSGPIIPWEAGPLRDLPAFFQTVGAALSGPVRFPLRVPYLRTGDVLTPLVFAVVCATLGHGLAALIGIFGGRVAPLPAPPGGLPALPPLPAYVWDLLFMPALPLVFLVALLVQVGMAHGLLGLMGARRAPLSATLRVFAYAQVGHLIIGLPVVGRYAVDLYAVFLILGGLRAAHGAGFLPGLVALLPMMLLNGLFGR